MSRIPVTHIITLTLTLCHLTTAPSTPRLLETTTTTTDTSTTTTNTEETAPSEIQITGSQANYETIPTLIISMEAIMAAYTLIFENLPEDQTGKDTSTLDDIQAGLETYKKVRNFVVVVTSKREEMLKDLNYVKNNMSNLGLSKYEILAFYDLRSTYEKLVRNFKAYEPGFQAKDAHMDAECKQYMENISGAVKAIEVIMEAEQIVWDKTKFIRDQINESTTSNAVLSSIDAVLMLMLELLQYRKSVIAELEIAMPKLIDMSFKRERFIQILTDEMLYIGVSTTTDQDIGVGVLGAWVVVLMGLFWWGN